MIAENIIRLRTSKKASVNTIARWTGASPAYVAAILGVPGQWEGPKKQRDWLVLVGTQPASERDDGEGRYVADVTGRVAVHVGTQARLITGRAPGSRDATATTGRAVALEIMLEHGMSVSAAARLLKRDRTTLLHARRKYLSPEMSRLAVSLAKAIRPFQRRRVA